MNDSLFPAPRRHRQPICYSLCGECLTVTADEDWVGLNMADDGQRVPADPTDDPTFYRCPCCGYDHVDDDDDPGVWSGYQWQMHKQRRELLDERDSA